jgi:thioredoxin 1
VASENVTILSDENFSDTISGKGEPVLVDFWAEWCGPCKMIAPILDEIADEQAGSVRIAKLNVDDAPDTARQYEVMSIPTMILFKDGEPVKKIVGAKPKDAILGELAEYL